MWKLNLDSFESNFGAALHEVKSRKGSQVLVALQDTAAERIHSCCQRTGSEIIQWQGAHPFQRAKLRTPSRKWRPAHNRLGEKHRRQSKNTRAPEKQFPHKPNHRHNETKIDMPVYLNWTKKMKFRVFEATWGIGTPLGPQKKQLQPCS